MALGHIEPTTGVVDVFAKQFGEAVERGVKRLNSRLIGPIINPPLLYGPSDPKNTIRFELWKTNWDRLPRYVLPRDMFQAKKFPSPIPMGPWDVIEDDRVLGITTNSTDRGAEGDEFMGDAVNRILTPEFRVSFPKVFKAEAFQEGQDPKYSMVMLFPKKMAPDQQKRMDALKALASATAKAKWGDKMPKNLRSPFRDGAEKDLPGYEDVIFVSASSKVKPGLVNEDAEPMLNPEDFYPGCYAHAYLTCYAYDTAGNRGVAFGLSTVQKTRDGDPFAPRNNAQDDFAPVNPGTAVAEEATDIEDVFGK